MFVHAVYFYLKNSDSEADRNALYAGLKTLATIPDISTSFVGPPAETRRPVIDSSYDLAMVSVFADKAAHDVYQEHPTHLQFVADCAHLWERVQIYDTVG